MKDSMLNIFVREWNIHWLDFLYCMYMLPFRFIYLVSYAIVDVT